MSKALLASVFALAAAGRSSRPRAAAPRCPSIPTFAKDVQPIFDAHCMRCHDETAQRGLNVTDAVVHGAPTLCHLNRYYDEPGRLHDAGVSAPCSVGASTASPVRGVLPGSSGVGLSVTEDEGGMPPLPAPALNDYESAVVNKWMNNLGAGGAPIAMNR